MTKKTQNFSTNWWEEAYISSFHESLPSYQERYKRGASLFNGLNERSFYPFTKRSSKRKYDETE